jgi:hypothetical protein
VAQRFSAAIKMGKYQRALTPEAPERRARSLTTNH